MADDTTQGMNLVEDLMKSIFSEIPGVSEAMQAMESIKGLVSGGAEVGGSAGGDVTHGVTQAVVQEIGKGLGLG